MLVHKLASLLLLEDVKHEQLLMLTFSRAAATEFKQRLMQLIGNAAHFVEIKTCHSYCFDLLGRVGNLDEAGDVVKQAAEMINNGEVEP
ncbi:UvrD-helicase domain-containing protein, partial [Nocardioides oceani]|uniref:UvrD-helicase domain-containing protein n=1 Tax=Nocardioides oceani TaxID=3058369 RepID=UPI0034DE28AD